MSAAEPSQHPRVDAQPESGAKGPGAVSPLRLVDEISSFRLGRVNVDKVPPNRLAALARTGLGSKAPNLERTPEPKAG